MKNRIDMKKGFRNYIVVGAFLILTGFAIGGSETPKAQAKADIALKKASVNLTIKVDNLTNTYGKSTIRIKTGKGVSVKKVTYKVKNKKIASVTKKGVVKSLLAGNTSVAVNVKYTKKNSRKTKTKKLTYTITVNNEFLREIPRTGMKFNEKGEAEPIFPLTELDIRKGNYSNEASYTDRFPVYVETDYDTDQDGKRDLVSVFIQVSKAATDGSYKAPVLMIPNTYMSEGIPDKMVNNTIQNGSFDYKKLNASPEKRTPLTEVSTADIRNAASDYVNDMKNHSILYYSVNGNDYFLSRGYAVVLCQGLGGAFDSEGLRLCGEKIEAEAYKAVVEWLHGDRAAFADRKGTKAIKADWCNGHVAMSGLSYLGTLAYEVATTGVEGLDTVIPLGAICSWYDYVYQQGAIINLMSANYVSGLSQYCSARYNYKKAPKKETDPAYYVYNDYLKQLNYDETKALGRYDEFWYRFAFHKGGNISVPALLIEGLNDFNVTTKQTMMMRKAFKDAGQPVKVLLHQGGHETPNIVSECASDKGTAKEEDFFTLENKWLSHYLMGVKNDVVQMKDFTVQSNVDGSWSSFDEKDLHMDQMKILPQTDEKESAVSFDKKADYVLDWNSKGETFVKKGNGLVWKQEVTEDTTVSGSAKVHLRVKMPDTKKHNPALSVLLMDESDTEFGAYEYDPKYPFSVNREASDLSVQVDALGKQFLRMARLKQTQVKSKLISVGTVNLLMPNAGWEPETCSMPADPIQNDTWYDYTVYLQPEHYTVKKGHRLSLYITGFCNFGKDELKDVVFPEKYSEKQTTNVQVSADYSFTLDNKKCHAEIPTVR